MKPAPRTNKLLVVLPMWSGDRLQAQKLATLLADLEPAHSEIADLVFVTRSDCKAVDLDVQAHVSRKFDLFNVTSGVGGTGWPSGCNSVLCGALQWTLQGIWAAKLPAYRGLVILESDACPLTRDPIGWIRGEWTKLKDKACVAGALVPSGGRDHINGGCCVLSADPKFLNRLVTLIGGIIATGRGGWDWELAAQFKMEGWANLPGIRSHWRRPAFSAEEWDQHVDAGIRFLHGVKNDSLLDLARQRLL